MATNTVIACLAGIRRPGGHHGCRMSGVLVATHAGGNKPGHSIPAVRIMTGSAGKFTFPETPA